MSADTADIPAKHTPLGTPLSSRRRTPLGNVTNLCHSQVYPVLFASQVTTLKTDAHQRQRAQLLDCMTGTVHVVILSLLATMLACLSDLADGLHLHWPAPVLLTCPYANALHTTH